MSALLEVVLLALYGLASYLVARLLAPPRLVFAARVNDDREGKSRVLRLTVQSYESSEVVGPFVIEIEPDGPEDLVEGVELQAYVGTDDDFRALRLEQDPFHLRLEVDHIRPLKTWTFNVPCPSSVSCARIRVRGDNRPVGFLGPIARAEGIELPSIPAGSFELSWTADLEETSSRRTWQDGLSLRGVRIVVLACAAQVLFYFLGMDGLHRLGFTSAIDPIADGLAAVTLLVAVTLLYALTTPTWPVIAQGYQEWRALKPAALERADAPSHPNGSSRSRGAQLR